MIDLTISIVNTNNEQLLKECLHSIYHNAGGISLDIYVVDNVSTDGSVAMVREEFPQVNLICNQSRLCYSANHNQVLCRPLGRYVLILNDDTVIGPGVLDGLVAFMDGHPEAGAASCKIINSDGSLQANCARLPTLLTSLLEALFLDRLFPPWSETSPLFMSAMDIETVREVEFLGGACILLRKEALADVGLLDDQLLSGYEEADWLSRARQRGWKAYYVPCGQVMHYFQATTEWLWGTDRRMMMQLKDRFRYFRKHHGWLAVQLLRWVVSLRAVIRLAILVVLYPVRRSQQAELRRQMARNLTRVRLSWERL